MSSGKSWTPNELERLHELWGVKTVPEIAKLFGRSINAVKIKAVRRGLLSQARSGEMMSARAVSELLGVDIHTVCDWWILKCGLKAKKKCLGVSKQTTTIIMFEDLLAWLREHDELWDSRRVEPYALGIEYDWLVEKRGRDRELPRRRLQKWTPTEDRQLILMYRRGDKSKAEIALALGRSYSSVEHRLIRLDVWGTGRHISDEERREKKKKQSDVFTQRSLMLRLTGALRAYRNSLEFGEYWQKDTCQRWDKLRGCTAGEANCDECSSFLRILPQYCVRCGATFLERAPNRMCARCREQRKKNGYKKYLRLHGGIENELN